MISNLYYKNYNINMRREGKLHNNHTLRRRNTLSCNPIRGILMNKSDSQILKGEQYNLHLLNSSNHYYPPRVIAFLPDYTTEEIRHGHIVNKNYVTDRINLNVIRLLREKINDMKSYQQNHKQGKKHKTSRLLEYQDL